MQPSGVRARKNLWEVRHDPYDVSRIFVRGPDGWITCSGGTWTGSRSRSASWPGTTPAASLAADGRAATEQQIADAVAGLLRRAHQGPGAGKTRRRCPGGTGGWRPGPRRSRRPRAAAPAHAGCRGAAADARARPPEPPGDGTPSAEVIPLAIFDPFAEADKRW